MRGLLLALALLSLGVTSAIGKPCLANVPGLEHMWRLFTKTIDVAGTAESSHAARLFSEPRADSNRAANNVTRQLTDHAQDRSIQQDKSTRQHKAFFVDYPTARRAYQSKKKTTAKKQKPKRKDSVIHFIKLPPAPYSYVPGLGYISRPPSFSASALAAAAQEETAAPEEEPSSSSVADPLIKLPIDFVSNGKPISVQHWHSPTGSKQPNRAGHKPDSPIVRLNRGPYTFNGKPVGVYDLKRTPRPDRPNLV